MIAALALAAASLWQPIAPDVAYAPTTLTAPTPATRRVLLKIGKIVALYEYDCTERTAAMLYVMRPEIGSYVPERASVPHTYRSDSVHGVLAPVLCNKGRA